MFAIFDINIKTLAQTLSATKSAENLSAPGHQVENKNLPQSEGKVATLILP